MKKILFIFTIVIFISVLVVGCFNNEISEDQSNYIENVSFENFNLNEFLKQSIKKYTSVSHDNLKIEEFSMTITNEKKINFIDLNINKKSILQNERYGITYNQDNYFKVKEDKIKKSESKIGITIKEFLSKFNNLQNIISFDESDYKYYSIKLLSPYNIKFDNNINIFVVGDNGIEEPKDKEIEGVCFMVYGQPVKKDDKPTYYFLK